ncbi:MAG: hypothetical protein QNJ00_09095 [Woeseiaceae bacterium]|nr:hypothetical protein [Woeseiaceae bacterium]
MLRVRLSPDDYKNYELSAWVDSEGFSGQGSGWFSDTEILEFASGLLSVASFAKKEARLLGGPVGASMPGEYCLDIRAYPIDSLGHFGVQVALRRGLFDRERIEQCPSVMLEVVTDTSSLEQFGSGLRELLQGGRDEAVLGSSN